MMEVAFLLLMVVAAATVNGRATGDDCVCTLEFNLVCGNDDVSYSNPCVARCSGAKVIHEGRCAVAPPDQLLTSTTTPCGCSLLYLPVCGIDGKTYPNRDCATRCGGVSVAHEGTCQPKAVKLPKNKTCFCPLIYLPVCGTDGKTYDNECVAKCRGVSIAHKGKCQPKAEKLPKNTTCFCPLNFRPVCGTDGKTYENDCVATCRGVSIAHKGECQPKPVKLPAKRNCVCLPVGLYEPVCGSDGKTYDNECLASCGGVVSKQGKCPKHRGLDENCYCATAKLDPVCGKDGKTYSNGCEAHCSNAGVRSDGPCEVQLRQRRRRRLPGTSADCACNKSLLKVCGNDGVTYDNPDCATRCGKVTDYVIGACSDVCACNNKSDPVCHVITGTKYVNRCYASCLRAESTQLESCDETDA